MGRNNKAGNYDKSLYQTPIYRSWYNMKSRCLNPKSTNYKKWGGRGISVCNEWMKFDGFLNDMYASYKEGYQIDRIDNDGDYEPSNCRWASRKTQCRNKSNNTSLELNGVFRTLTEWAEISGLKRSTVSQRFYVYKWPLHECLNYKI